MTNELRNKKYIVRQYRYGNAEPTSMEFPYKGLEFEAARRCAWDLYEGLKADIKTRRTELVISEEQLVAFDEKE